MRRPACFAGLALFCLALAAEAGAGPPATAVRFVEEAAQRGVVFEHVIGDSGGIEARDGTPASLAQDDQVAPEPLVLGSQTDDVLVERDLEPLFEGKWLRRPALDLGLPFTQHGAGS